MFSTDVACCCPPNWNWTRGFAREKDCLFEIGLLRCCSRQTANAPASDPRLGYSLRSSKEVWKLNFRQKVGKARNTVFFQHSVSRLRRVKGRLAKAAGAETSRQMRDEQLHAVVARSTFGSKKCQSTSCSEHFWKLRCGKSVRRCGAKHMVNSKVAKHVGFGALLEVELWKKRTPLRREAHFQLHVGLGRLLEVELWKKCTPLWRQAHFQVKM